MSFANFLKGALPFIGPVVGGVLGGIGAGRQANQAQAAAAAAAREANRGFEYLQGSPIGTQYLPTGSAANQQIAGLLGVGGDPAAAQAAFDNYLSSVGYQGQLRAGTDAITAGAASRGALGSGATLRALQGYGQQLGQQHFGNYLGQLQGLSGAGLQAGSVLGNAGLAAGLAAGGHMYGGGMAAAGARRDQWDQYAGAAGGVLEGLQNMFNQNPEGIPIGGGVPITSQPNGANTPTQPMGVGSNWLRGYG